MAITFQTDGQDDARGFYFTAIALKPGAAGDAGLPCGTTLLERGNHTILSKNYPAKYEPYSYCKWQLQAIEPTDRVQLSCDSFRLENFGSRCEMDWMAVDGVRYCGTTAPSVAAVGELTVEFVADYFAQQKDQLYRCRQRGRRSLKPTQTHSNGWRRCRLPAIGELVAVSKKYQDSLIIDQQRRR